MRRDKRQKTEAGSSAGAHIDVGSPLPDPPASPAHPQTSRAWSIAAVRVLLEADKDTLVELGDFNIAMITRALKGAQGAGSTFNEQGVINGECFCV